MTLQQISIIAAAFAVAIGSLMPVFVGLAMIETMAIYCLVVALLVLFANPFLH
jgi:F0F1-type ATP synthase membrane subunit c/vacuolar-type H+-ATPase subunit K